MAIERSVIEAEDSTGIVHVVSDTATGNLAIDYTTYYERIATALETIATNSTTMVADITAMSAVLVAGVPTIASTLTTVSGTLTDTETSITAIKDLASGDGIRTLSPYEWLGLVSAYKLYVDDAGAIGLEALAAYKDKVSELPKGF